MSFLTGCCACIVNVSTAIPRMHIGTPHSILTSASQQWQYKGYESLQLTLIMTLQSHHPRSQTCWPQMSMLFLVQETSTLEENQSKCSTIGPESSAADHYDYSVILRGISRISALWPSDARTHIPNFVASRSTSSTTEDFLSDGNWAPCSNRRYSSIVL